MLKMSSHFQSFCLLAFAFLFACFLTSAECKLTSSGAMVAAAATGLANEIAEDTTERGKTACKNSRSRKFRTIDGSCNNPKNQGAAHTPLTVFVEPPAYQDGFDEPRTRGENNKRLPSPRTISRQVHPSSSATNGNAILYMQFGQFIDHDFALAPVPTESGRIIRCCGKNNVGNANPLPKECFPLRLPGKDPDFIGNCFEFVRSEKAEEEYEDSKKTKKGGKKIRRQLNGLTHFVDASMVYGSDAKTLRRVRDRKNPYLLRSINTTRQGELLPINKEKNCFIEPKTNNNFCFLAGEIRVNEQPGLTTMHTMFLRLHNNIARVLRSTSPKSASDLRVFQQTRKIVGAVLQNILYGEWLPINIGEITMKARNLNTGKRIKFDPRINPSLLNEFSTAAFRMGHSTIPDFLPAGGRNLLLREHFMRPRIVRNRYNQIAIGLANSTIQAGRVDRFITEEVTGHLFERAPRKGVDLVALNIHRGRDHGLRPYNDVREKCGLPRIKNFNDNRFDGKALKNVYADIDDVDLFVGGLAEPPCLGGAVGETFNCIIAEQFERLKFGDRHFFETTDTLAGFNDAQLNNIYQFDMAAVMCLTTDIPRVQRNAFRAASKENRFVGCRRIQRQFETLLKPFKLYK